MRRATSTDKPRVLRNIAVTFVLLTLILLAVIGYTAFSRAVVTVELGSVARGVTFRVPLVETQFGSPVGAGSVAATFLESTETAEDTFLLANTGSSGRYGGVVIIRNTTGNDQPLVATTRLLTPDGKLFRIVEGVRVPAQGEVSVVARADEEGSSFAVGPTRFTIPGLRETLQDDIFAVSTTPMVPGGAEVQVVGEQDLENARQTLRQRLITNAQGSLISQVPAGALSTNDFITEVISEEASAEVGEEAAALTMTIEMRIIGVAFSKAELAEQIRQEAGGAVELLAADQLQYRLSNYDDSARTVVLNGRATVANSIDEDSSIFATHNFVASTPEEVASYLQNFEGIAGVEVELSPYWQDRLPRNPERIEVRFR